MTDEAQELINRYNSLITKTHNWLEKEKLRQKIKFIQLNEKKLLNNDIVSPRETYL